MRLNPLGALRSWLGTWPMSEFPNVFGSGPTATGVAVSEYTALNYSAVWSAVSVISADVASLPLVLYKRTGDGGKDRYVDSRLYELLHDAPNPEMTSMVFREALQAHAMTWGNAYAEIQRDELGRPSALWPITPDRVSPFRSDDTGALLYRVTNARGAQSVLTPRNMLHVPGLGFDGVMGYSVIQKARESFALGIATEAFGATFFGNGSTFGGVLSHPQNLTKEVKQSIRESLDAVHQGVDRAHKFVILGGGTKYDKLGIPPNDAQFLETRKFQVTEVARWFQIPPHKLGDLERATFSNIEQQDIEYYRSCLRRWLVRWEQELTRKLIPPLERRQQFIKHNVEGFLRGDSTARASFYTSMFNIGAYSINMILESEDLNKIGAEGDVHFVGMNLQPADIAMEGPPQPPSPPPPPEPDNPKPDDKANQARMLAEIASTTAAIQIALTAQRDALTQAELDKATAAVATLIEERDHLQRQFDDFRERHASDAQTLQASVETAIQETATERAAHEAAGTALVAAQTAHATALREAHEATERREAEAATARAEAEATAATAVRDADAARLTAQQAETEAAAAKLAAEQAAAKQADADAQRAEAERVASMAITALSTQREAEAGRLTAMLAAHRALMVDALQRMLAPELDRARKHQASPEKLRTWAESFYVTHEDRCVDVLRPAVRAHLAWKQSAEDIEAVTVALVREHIVESQRQLRAVTDGEPDDLSVNLERMLQRWEQQRAGAVADRILKEEVDHVRRLT